MSGHLALTAQPPAWPRCAAEEDEAGQPLRPPLDSKWYSSLAPLWIEPEPVGRRRKRHDTTSALLPALTLRTLFKRNSHVPLIIPHSSVPLNRSAPSRVRRARARC